MNGIPQQLSSEGSTGTVAKSHWGINTSCTADEWHPPSSVITPINGQNNVLR